MCLNCIIIIMAVNDPNKSNSQGNSGHSSDLISTEYFNFHVGKVKYGSKNYLPSQVNTILCADVRGIGLLQGPLLGAVIASDWLLQLEKRTVNRRQ